MYSYSFQRMKHCLLCFFQNQIEFLNSVIIDLQKKNDDLKQKIDKMVEASLNGNNVEDMDNHERYL